MNELERLILHLNSLPPEKKQDFLKRFSQVTALACSIVLILFLYPFVPNPVRLIAIPTILAGTWFIAGKIVFKIFWLEFKDKILEDRSSLEFNSEKIPKVPVFSLKNIIEDLKKAPSFPVIAVFTGVALFICGMLTHYLH